MTVLITYFLLFYSLVTTLYIIYLKTWTCRSLITFVMFLLGATRQFLHRCFQFLCSTSKKETLIIEPFMQDENH